MANEITFDKLPQAVGYLTEQVERIHKIVVALQPQTAIDKHRIVSQMWQQIAFHLKPLKSILQFPTKLNYFLFSVSQK